MTEPLKLAVYGTLKSTEPNHSVLGDDAKVLAKGIRLPGFSLYDVAFGMYPGAVHDPEGFGVEVEIVEVPPHMLAVVDQYEGFNGEGKFNLFIREAIKLPNGDDALMYVYNVKVDNKPDGFFKPIPSGRWEDCFNDEVPAFN